MKIEEIQIEIETTEVTPSRAADLGVLVSAKYATACDNYIKANIEYARQFTILRNSGEFKSDTSVERYLDHQECGLQKHKWKYMERKTKIMLEALKTLVYVKTAEAKNIL